VIDRVAELSEKVVVVTGSSSGMGRAMALALAAAGAAVVCCDVRSSARADGRESDIEVDTHDLIARRGGSGLFVEANVAQAEDVERLIDTTVATLGRVDVLVNNAGVMVPIRPITEDTEETYERVMAVNSKGVWLCCRAAVAQMIKQPPRRRLRGKIVNVSSIAAIAGHPNYACYSASKGAVMSMTYALASEAGPHKITVNALAPGAIRTAMTAGIFTDGSERLDETLAMVPLGELGEAEDMAGPTVFLASDASDYVNGVMLPVDGGLVLV
jgi:NAD(P)-dependent dehydrogenase (short-subunit alcohol dehydrogenase family)